MAIMQQAQVMSILVLKDFRWWRWRQPWPP